MASRVTWTAVEVLSVVGTSVTVGTPDEYGGMATLVLEPPHVQPHFLPEVGSVARVLKIDNVPFIYPDAITDAAGMAVKATDPLTGLLYEASRIGSGTAVVDSAGGLKAAIGEDGVAHLTGLDTVGWPTVSAADWTGAGGRLDLVLDRRPRGLVAYGTFNAAAVGTNSANGIGYFEIRGDRFPGRQYKLCTSDINLQSTVAGDTVRLRVMQTSAALGTLPASPGVASGVAVAGASGVAGSDVTIAELLLPFVGPVTVRWLLAYARTAGTGLASIAGRTTGGSIHMWVEDIGPSRSNTAVANDGGSDGIGGGGATPPVPPVTRTLTVPASWVETYLEGVLTPYTATAVQGHVPSQGMRRAKIGFPALTALAGATITGVQLRLNASFWGDPAGGTAAVGFHGQATATGVQGALTAEDAFRVPDWQRASTRLLDLMAYAPQEWVTGVKAGIRLGGEVGVSPEFYGRFNAPSDADPMLRPELTFTYTL